MSYTECIKNFNQIVSDMDDDRYVRMRLVEIYGCILCSDMTTDQCNHVLDIWSEIGSKVGLTISRVSDIFYNSEW